MEHAGKDIAYWHHRQGGDDCKTAKAKPQEDAMLHPDGLSDMGMEMVINHVLGSLGVSSVPPRFAMSDMVAIDEDGMAALEVSPEWGVLLPHVSRAILAEQKMPAAMVRFVPRMPRNRPQVAYAVR